MIKNNINNANNNINKPKIKEVDDINMQIFGMREDNINEVDFNDRMDVDERFMTCKYIINQADKQDGDDWEYLKKTVSKDGKYLSDDFIKYHHITDQLVEDEDDIIHSHMNIIKVNNYNPRKMLKC